MRWVWVSARVWREARLVRVLSSGWAPRAAADWAWAAATDAFAVQVRGSVTVAAVAQALAALESLDREAPER